MKSHFTFTNKQRNGIFYLLLIIVALQVSYFFIDFSDEEVLVDKVQWQKMESEIDAIRQSNIEGRKLKIYPFNPNYITDFKGATLGMSNEEIDRLLHYRNQNKWINSAEDFQNITKVSDSLLNQISPYFKFPEWVNKPAAISKYPKVNKIKTFAQKKDLNLATAKELQSINGVGEVLSSRIVNYRNKLVEGFVADIQLNDVYGLSPEVVNNITAHFTVKNAPKIKTIDLNKASVEDLVSIQHIDYEIAYQIIEYRQLHEGFSSLNELAKVKDFPISKIEIIKLYLHLR